MSVNRTKKIILKTRRQKEDKYVGDGREIKQNVISETFLGNTNENNKNKKIQNKEEEQLKNNWDDIEKSEMDLERELALWKSKLEAEKIKSAENINLINNEIKEKNRKLKIVTTNNKNEIMDEKNSINSEELKKEEEEKIKLEEEEKLKEEKERIKKEEERIRLEEEERLEKHFQLLKNQE